MMNALQSIRKTADIPRELEEVLSQEEHNYIKDLSSATLGLLDAIFGDVKFRHMTTYGDNAIRGLINAKLRASKLRRTFYEVTGFDRSQLRDMVVPTSSQPLTGNDQALYQQFVQDVLFINNENTYSTWVNLSDEEVFRICNSLKVFCTRGCGSHDDMLICCKACLRLQEKPSVEELEKIVGVWVSKFPDSEWAHLFNYMIHFPIPEKRLASFNYSAKESIKKCDKIVLKKTGKGFRKSGVEYFLGKGTGLYAIANSQQFRSLENGESKTNLWRSREISEKLERVCGQKDVNFNGVITYQGIQLRFDDKRYPKQSKDDLWFYVGFSLSGLFAYDPVDNDTYAAISSHISSYRFISDPIPNDSDVKKFSALVKKRLRDLNFKDFSYVLIANKLPPRYRGTPKLAFLQNIPWLAVFDLFDATSKKDGLYYACNETTDAPRAKLRSLDDFKEAPSDWISRKPDKDFDLSTRGTTWILGIEEMQKGHWIKFSRDCFYRALSTYKLCCPLGRLMCLFLGLDESNIQEMVDMMECCFSILGDSASNCVTVISESKHVTDAFIKASSLQRELRDCCITDIPWSLLREIVREMVGPTKFEERGAKTELPYFTGLKEVFNKIIHSWDDLDVYIPNPRLPRLVEDIEKERSAFYKGAQASQSNLFHNHCIERTLEEETMQKIEQALKALSLPSKDISSHVITVTVTYEPGSGATTLCRRILWKKRTEYRCAVVKAITTNTDYQIEQLQEIMYDDKNIKFAPPCLVLVDNFPENETRRLTEKITRRQTKCVILSTFPIGKLSANSHFDLTLRQLDDREMSLIKDILINITSDSKRRRGAEEVLEREKRFIWFGLELFGREYNKIEERVQNHIKSTLDFLDDFQKIHETVLNFCCFLHYYSDGRAILPHPVVTDLLYEDSNENEENCSLIQHIHELFGGLVVEGFDETNGYYGWRPAHSLVSEAVMSRINVEETAIALMEQIQNGQAYVNKFLKEQVFKVVLDRKRNSDPVCL